jgi:hypothetical protein
VEGEKISLEGGRRGEARGGGGEGAEHSSLWWGTGVGGGGGRHHRRRRQGRAGMEEGLRERERAGEASGGVGTWVGGRDERRLGRCGGRELKLTRLK